MTFTPDKDIPSLTGKVIVVTGGTAGLGAGSVVELAKHQPAHIIFTGRNATKAEAVKAKVAAISSDVKVTFVELDISSFASIRQGAKMIQHATDRIDILMLNAGIMAVPPALSKDGYEIQFATNHVGHALLVRLLLPLLESTAKLPGADVRVINMTSTAVQLAPRGGIVFNGLKTAQAKLGGMGATLAKWRRYGQSKLAQMLYTRELAKHYPDIRFVAVHPGIIMTDLFGNIPLMTKLPILLMSAGRQTPVEKGHFNQVWAATADKSKVKNGEYYEPIGVVGGRSGSAANDKLAGELWDWTEKEIVAVQ